MKTLQNIFKEKYVKVTYFSKPPQPKSLRNRRNFGVAIKTVVTRTQ